MFGMPKAGLISRPYSDHISDPCSIYLYPIDRSIDGLDWIGLAAKLTTTGQKIKTRPCPKATTIRIYAYAYGHRFRSVWKRTNEHTIYANPTGHNLYFVGQCSRWILAKWARVEHEQAAASQVHPIAFKWLIYINIFMICQQNGRQRSKPGQLPAYTKSKWLNIFDMLQIELTK